jgi:hypothetical protein
MPRVEKRQGAGMPKESERHIDCLSSSEQRFPHNSGWLI